MLPRGLIHLRASQSGAASCATTQVPAQNTLSKGHKWAPTGCQSSTRLPVFTGESLTVASQPGYHRFIAIYGTLSRVTHYVAKMPWLQSLLFHYPVRFLKYAGGRGLSEFDCVVLHYKSEVNPVWILDWRLILADPWNGTDQATENQRLLCLHLYRHLSLPKHPGSSLFTSLMDSVRLNERRTPAGREVVDSVFMSLMLGRHT